MNTDPLTPVILFRPDRDNQDEMKIAQQYLPVVAQRTECRDNLVVGRYSVLPYYEELANDLAAGGSQLVNLPTEHEWIASFAWYDALAPFTPRSWFDLSRTNYQGPFVVKGVTNSRKYQWDTHMFAATRADALRISSELNNDSFLGTQRLVYREYVPLKTFDVGINGIRYANEWRCFFYKTTRLAAGYYWATAPRPELGEFAPLGQALAQRAASVAALHAAAFVLDVAETEAGPWIVVEVNDLQMSGLPYDPDDSAAHDLYRNLDLALRA
jgi:hypothetical protein